MSTDPSDAQAPDDPDADPEMKSDSGNRQADQAEGTDDPSETSGG
jgi:hypothetical protein